MNPRPHLFIRFTINVLCIFCSILFSKSAWAQPVISGFSPTSGAVGTTVTISGSGFNNTIAGNTVYLGGVKATITAAGNNSITAVVPNGASYEPITVTSNGLTGYSNRPFTITFSGVVNQASATSFSQAIDVDMSNSLSGIVTADINGDGKLDVITVDDNTFTPLSVSVNTSTVDKISFQKTSFDPRVRGNAVGVGDLDGDGKLDIVVVGNYENSYTLGVMKNTGSGGNLSLTRQVLSQLPDVTGDQLIIRDVDGDGKPDLVTLGIYTLRDSSQLAFYKNTSANGVISFTGKIVITPSKLSLEICMDDFDNDGKPDVAITNAQDNTVSVFRNSSTAAGISFVGRSDYAVGSYPTGLTSGDLDNDGKPEIIVTNRGLWEDGNTVSILKNTSTTGISFAAKTDLVAGLGPSCVGVMECNGDGKPDLAVSNHKDMTLSIFRNNGNGTISFAARNNYPYSVGVGGTRIRSGDINGDNVPEIITSSFSHHFTVFKNQVTIDPARFVRPVITSFSPVSGAVGSTVTITGTGFSTIAGNNIVYFGAVKATVTAASATSLSVTVPAQSTSQPISVTRDQLTAFSSMPFLITYPGGEAPFNSNFFMPRRDSVEANGLPQRYCVSDFDGDGKPDLVLGKTGLNYKPGPLSVYRNIGSPGTMAFAPKVEIPDREATGAIAADVNGDGKPDLVLRNGPTEIYINTSTPGTISFHRVFHLYNSGAAAAADFDSDGRIDLAVTAYNGVYIYRNMTVNDSVFFYDYSFYAGTDITEIAVTDFSGDGRPDIALVNRNDQQIALLRNTCFTPGSISFATGVNLPAGRNPYDVACGDLDSDGKPDIAIVDYFDSTLSVYRNTGATGSLGFAARVNYKAGSGSCQLTIDDLNGDGKQDIVVVNKNDSSISLYKNKSTAGAFSFDEQVRYRTGTDPLFGKVADWDGNGPPDVIVSNGNQTISFFQNQLMRPVITSFTPAVLTPGATITINGFNFTNASQVKLGSATVQSFTIVSANQITAIVGQGAEGDVSVTTPLGTAVLGAVSFAPPVITSFSPVSGAAGSSVTITGSNFSAIPASNHVYFGAVQATVTAASTTSLTVEVPVGAAACQPISVSTFNKIAWATKSFQYTFAGIGNGFNTGSFDNKVEFFGGKKPKGICTGDLDGDGLPDVVLANDSNSYSGITILKNNGSPGKVSFEPAVEIPLILTASNICMADLNADGKLDVVILDHNNGYFNVLINTSTPGVISFDKPLTLYSVSDAIDLAAADLDQDGRTDLVITADWPDSYSILRNTSANGVISFKQELGLPAGGGNITGLALSDINGDSKPELIMCYDISSLVRIFNNVSTVGNISFNIGTYLNVGWPYGVTTGDIDGDGKSDLILKSKPFAAWPTTNIYKNTSTGGGISFSSGISLPGGFSNNVALGDLDGDNKLDLAASGDSVAVFKNASTPGNISFLPRVAYKAYGNPRICLTDMDADGKADIVGANIDNLGVGSGVFVIRNQVGEAKVVPSGPNPVTGTVGNKVTADATVQTLNGNVYVQRHYDLMPANDPANATATVTLYFTQQEFDNFNAAPNHGLDLPKNANDATGKANVRVYQYHGFSTTSLPGTYTGQGKEINPDDASIVWNAAMQWWEITFDVNGFSGFFISTAGFNYNQVPAPVITARSATSFCMGDKVVLVANVAINNQWYKDGVAINGANAATYQTGVSGSYTVTATNNGITSPQSAGQVVLASAVPAKPVISQNGPELLSGAAAGNQWYLEGTLIAGATGQSYKPTATGNYSVIATNGGCASVESARYYFLSTGIIDLDNDNFISLTPNPVTDKAWLSFKLNGITTLTVQVVNMQGQLCGNRRTLSNGNALDVSALPKGLYFVQVISTAGKLNYTLKLIKL